jgi:putative transposase
MPRAPRTLTAGAVYRVGARGNAGTPIVLDDADRESFLDTVARAARRHSLVVHAYSLLDDRYDLLLETPRANLSVAMRELNGFHAQRFNQRHDRWGHLFGDRFSAQPVEGGIDLALTCVDVVLAPVLAGVCSHPGAWRWSSYAATVGDAPAPPFLTTSVVLAGFTADPEDARADFRSLVARELRIRRALEASRR